MDELEALRYPVGMFRRVETLSEAERLETIGVLAGLPRQLEAAVAGLSVEQLETAYRPGGWTVRQVVHHVADSHMNAYARMKLALTENWPAVFAYDQEAWARLADARLPVSVSLGLVRGVHERWMALLGGVAGADWSARGYLHPENGAQTLEQVLALYGWHSRHHLGHVRLVRAG